MSSNQYLHRQCPVCRDGAPESREVSSQKRGEDLSYEELIPYWNGFFKEKIFFSYSRCQKCKLLFAPVFYNLNQLEKLYAQMAPNMDLVPMAALLRTQKGYFEVLKRYSDMENGYIEVGPDVGIFTINCCKEGNFDAYWLCEPNTLVTDALAKVVAGKPFTIIEDMFGFSSIPDKSASVAVMIQVLDHLLDPVATLSELKAKLLPGAKLLLVTHNEQSLLRKIVKWRWPAFCLQHPQIYNPDSITALLEKSGYEVNVIERTKNYFEFGFLVKHLLWAFGLRVKSAPKILNFTVGLKLGNMIAIATPRSK
jgi:hypothetical protein